MSKVKNPNYYMGRFGLEAIDVIKNFLTEEQYLGYLIGNEIKYLLRHQNKNGSEDLLKMNEYTMYELEVLEEREAKRDE